jgi:hypothetical protein
MASMRSWGVIARSLVGLALLIGGCTASSSPSASEDSDAPTYWPLIEEARRSPLADDPGPDEGGAAFEAAVFADGRVTFAEYERAINETVECIRRAGVTAEGPFRWTSPDAGIYAHRPGYDYGLFLTVHHIVLTDDDDRRWSVESARCQAQWSERIERVWLGQLRPSEAQIQKWWDNLYGCADDKGIPREYAEVAAVFQCRPWENGGSASG